MKPRAAPLDATVVPRSIAQAIGSLRRSVERERRKAEREIRAAWDRLAITTKADRCSRCCRIGCDGDKNHAEYWRNDERCDAAKVAREETIDDVCRAIRTRAVAAEMRGDGNEARVLYDLHEALERKEIPD